MMDWLISLVPWWAWLAAAIVAVVVVWRLLGWQGALMAGAGLLAALGYGKGRNDAALKAQARRDKEARDHVVIRNRVEDEVNSLGAQDVDERLKRWNRAED